MEIKPCPFCGGRASVKGQVKAFVKCERCNTRTSSYRFIADDEQSYIIAVKLAVDRWNRRVETC